MQRAMFEKSDFRVAHLNIRATGQQLTKAQSLIGHFARKKIDLICLSEIKISKQNKNYFHHKGYNTFLNTPTDHLQNSPKEGIAILISKNIDPQHIKVEDIDPGRASKVEFQVNDQKFTAFCIYAPSQGDSTAEIFYNKLLKITELPENPIILGDFNVVLDPKIDRNDPEKPYHKPKTSKLLNDYMLEHALVDPWRATHPQKSEFSWKNTSGSASRIDFTLIPAHLYHQVVRTEYYTPPHPDRPQNI